jgi:SagB-type dehydrogenase family enzyme
MTRRRHNTLVPLPSPQHRGEVSLEQALAERRSRREFCRTDLPAEILSQLLWSAQGTTHGDGYRTAPSAGALFPLELYAAVGAGLYRYVPSLHACELVGKSDFRPTLWKYGLHQECLREASCVFVICAVFERLRRKYGERAERYSYLEAGHVAQNLLLQAAALGLGGVPVGAFDEEDTRVALELPAEETPVYLVAIGVRR